MKFILVRSNYPYWNDCLNDLQQMLYPIHTESDKTFVLSINLNRFNVEKLIDIEFDWISWIQDHPSPACKMMKPWVEQTNDYMFGYVQAMKAIAGFDDRLYETPFFVNPNRFQQVPDNVVKKNCDVVFITNKGTNPYKMIDKKYHKIVESLMGHYENNCSIIRNEAQLETYVNNIGLTDLWQKGIEEIDNFSFRCFWVLNECIYRQSIVQELLDKGVNVKVYGHGWVDNPRFSHIAGHMIEGKDMPYVYRSGEYALHVDSANGKHQRPIEILLSGGKCLAPTLGVYDPARFNRLHFCDLQRKQLYSCFRAIMHDEPANYRHYPALQNYELYCYKEPI